MFGVVNASPDSLHQGSIVADASDAERRITDLLADGCQGLDVGGQGSTQFSDVVDSDTEWERLEPILPRAVAACDLVSIDTWRHDVMTRAMEVGVNVLNAADGMSRDETWAIAAEFEALVVLPFMNGPDPHNLAHVEGDPLDAMCDYFGARLAVADRYGLRNRCLIDPGTGFGPHGWEWADRYLYQKHVYSNLERLRTFGLPLYIPVPWKRTDQHDELLEIVMAQRPEFARVHEPARVLEVAAQVHRGR